MKYKEYKVKTRNDTGDQQWRDEYVVLAASDEEAEDISLTRWLEERFGRAAVSACLYTPSGHFIRSFGR